MDSFGMLNDDGDDDDDAHGFLRRIVEVKMVFAPTGPLTYSTLRTQ